jgi:hypothetical protein
MEARRDMLKHKIELEISRSALYNLKQSIDENWSKKIAKGRQNLCKFERLKP